MKYYVYFSTKQRDFYHQENQRKFDSYWCVNKALIDGQWVAYTEISDTPKDLENSVGWSDYKFLGTTDNIRTTEVKW